MNENERTKAHEVNQIMQYIEGNNVVRKRLNLVRLTTRRANEDMNGSLCA